MSGIARALAVVLVAVFAAATAAHAAGSTAMTVKMSLADAGGGAPDCQGCSGDEGSAPVCDQACLPPLAALPAGASLEHPALDAGLGVRPAHLPHDRPGPPDPAPPRRIDPS